MVVLVDKLVAHGPDLEHARAGCADIVCRGFSFGRAEAHKPGVSVLLPRQHKTKVRTGLDRPVAQRAVRADNSHCERACHELRTAGAEPIDKVIAAETNAQRILRRDRSAGEIVNRQNALHVVERVHA